MDPLAYTPDPISPTLSQQALIPFPGVFLATHELSLQFSDALSRYVFDAIGFYLDSLTMLFGLFPAGSFGGQMSLE